MTLEKLREHLAGFSLTKIDTEVFRATPVGQNGLVASTRGGRWMPAGQFAVLYTSLTKEGAMAEAAFRLGSLTPLPTKPIVLHQIVARLDNILPLSFEDLLNLGAENSHYSETNYFRTQDIGLAAAQIGVTGLRVPSARWSCDNLIVFDDKLDDASLKIVSSVEIDWLAWAERQAMHFIRTN